MNLSSDGSNIVQSLHVTVIWYEKRSCIHTIYYTIHTQTILSIQNCVYRNRITNIRKKYSKENLRLFFGSMEFEKNIKTIGVGFICTLELLGTTRPNSRLTRFSHPNLSLRTTTIRKGSKSHIWSRKNSSDAMNMGCHYFCSKNSLSCCLNCGI